jgi:DNA polymerase-4/protein ImuB
MRTLCVIVPHFPWRCEVLRLPALYGRSAIITYTPGSQKLVLDNSPELDGLQCDMPLQQALARHGGAELLPADIPYYRATFDQLLDALETISPLVEGAESGCAYLGIDGLQLIYPDDSAIIDAIQKVIPEVFSPQVGIAGNKFLSYLVACRCLPIGWRVFACDVEAFLQRLPCDVLPVSMRSKEKLRQFGLHTLGQVATLPQGPLLSQFGSEGQRIYELARGYDDTPLYPRMMEKSIEESATLPSVTVSLETILMALERLLGRVFSQISGAGLGIRSLAVWTRTWNAEQWERVIKFKELAMDGTKAITRIKRVMEDHPQPGPVEQVGIRVEGLGYPRGQQKSLFPEIRSKDHLREDIKQLELRLGNPQVYRVKEVEPWSRIPERRYMLMPSDR